MWLKVLISGRSDTDPPADPPPWEGVKGGSGGSVG